MSMDTLPAALLLVGFAQSETLVRFTRYYMAYAQHKSRVSAKGWAALNVRAASWPAHLMVDIYPQGVLGTKVCCAVDGITKLTSRNPEKVWLWVTRQLYLIDQKILESEQGVSS